MENLVGIEYWIVGGGPIVGAICWAFYVEWKYANKKPPTTFE
jgi:hypothetical protein